MSRDDFFLRCYRSTRLREEELASEHRFAVRDHTHGIVIIKLPYHCEVHLPGVHKVLHPDLLCRQNSRDKAEIHVHIPAHWSHLTESGNVAIAEAAIDHGLTGTQTNLTAALNWTTEIKIIKPLVFPNHSFDDHFITLGVVYSSSIMILWNSIISILSLFTCNL